MLPQYSHDLVTSMMLWLDNRLLNQGQAYTNITGVLYRQPATGVQGTAYVSPYRSWVYDSCAAGAMIPSGFYNASGQFLTRASGLVIDFINGRVICPQNWGDKLSGVYARKEVNVYFSSNEETDYVLEQVYGANQNLAYPITGFQGRALAAPMIMLTNASENNVPWAFGGQQRTDNQVRAVIITNSNYLQEGVNSLCRDASYKTIPFVSYADAPITSSGDLKNGTYSYCTDIFGRLGCLSGLWIQGVYANKVSERSNKNTTFFLSVLNFEVEKPRFPI